MKKEIYLAAGCFWGAQKYFDLIKGVLSTEVGYANGHSMEPTYEQVCSGETGFVETVHVVYDASVISLDFLLDLFFDAIDPTTKDKQGHDIGNQYRSGIYYIDDADVEVIQAVTHREQCKCTAPIVTEVLPFQNFYTAEEYHQKYLDKNPTGYCHIGPDLFAKAKAASQNK